MKKILTNYEFIAKKDKYYLLILLIINQTCNDVVYNVIIYFSLQDEADENEKIKKMKNIYEVFSESLNSF